MTRPVVVIGGGIIGMACAASLQREGLSVTVVDRGVAEARCSFGNAGSISAGSIVPLSLPGILAQVPGMLLDRQGALHIRPGYLPRLAPWLVRFVAAARKHRVDRAADALHALHQPAFDALGPLLRDAEAAHLLQRTGQLQLYPDEAYYQADRQGWDIRRAHGVRAEPVNADEIRQLEPDVGPDYRYGVFLPDEGMIVNPQSLLDALTEAFVARGGTYLKQEVRGIAARDGAVEIALDGASLAAGDVVLAAGMGSARLAAGIGDRIPLETQRGYHATIADSGVTLRRPVVAADRKCFATPMEMGLRLAGTVEFAGIDAEPDFARARALVGHGRRLFPKLRADCFSEWMGHRPCLPDSLPVIGRSPRLDRVVYAFGHGHLGMTGAATTGQHVAALVAGRKPEIDLVPFRPDRF